MLSKSNEKNERPFFKMHCYVTHCTYNWSAVFLVYRELSVFSILN